MLFEAPTLLSSPYLQENHLTVKPLIQSHVASPGYMSAASGSTDPVAKQIQIPGSIAAMPQPRSGQEPFPKRGGKEHPSSEEQIGQQRSDVWI